MTPRCLLRAAWLCAWISVLAGGAPSPVLALETVRLTVAPDPDLSTSLRDLSRLAEIEGLGEYGAQNILAAARADYRRLTDALFASGYYGPVISIRLDGVEASDLSPLESLESPDLAEIFVAPGPLFRFSRAEITPLPEDATLPEGFHAGEAAPSALVRKAAQAGIEAWRDAGHARARIAQQRIIADHADRSLDVGLTLDPGPKLSFGHLDLDCACRTGVSEARVRALAGLRPGTPFSPSALDLAEERLRRLGLFRAVSIVEKPGEGSEDVDLVARISEAPARRIEAGLTLSSLDGPTLHGAWEHRNILQRADTLRIEGEVSELAFLSEPGDAPDFDLSLRFEHPAFAGPDTLLYSQLALTREQEESYRIDKAGFEIGTDRPLGPHEVLGTGIGLDYTRSISGTRQRDFTLLRFPLSYRKDNSDSPFDPGKGYILSFSALPFLDLSRDRNAGMRLTGQVAAYKTVGPGILALRGKAGLIFGPGALNLPPDMLFYSGGSDSVRGHPSTSLLVARSDGARTGGQALAAASLEYRFPLKGSLGGVLFADYGQIAEDPAPWRRDASHAGVGGGLRYHTPIGPARLDLAFPVHGTTGAGMQIYLGLGQAF